MWSLPVAKMAWITLLHNKHLPNKNQCHYRPQFYHTSHKLTSPQTDKTQHNCSLYKIYKCSQPNSMPNNENTLTESRAVLQEIIFCLDHCERVTRANKCACLDEKYCTQQPSLCTVATVFLVSSTSMRRHTHLL